MKKKQLVALAVAAALAVPNTGLVASFTDMPVVVEAATAVTAQSSKLRMNLGEVKLNSTTAGIQKALETACRDKAVVLGETLSREYVDTRVEIRSGNADAKGTWTFVDREQTLKQGENKVKVRYTFDKVSDQSTVTGNGWTKNSDGKYSKEFTITVTGAKTVNAKTVLKPESWPVLSEKVYNADNADNNQLWADDVKNTANAYGKFSIETTNNSASATAGNQDVKVTYTLNPEWAFEVGARGDAALTGADTEAVLNGTTLVKTYNDVKVTKAIVKAEDIVWPELVDADKAAYQGDVKKTLTSSPTSSKVDFDLVQSGSHTPIGADAKYEVVGETKYSIKAALKDTSNYELAKGLQATPEDTATYKDITVNVAGPEFTVSMDNQKLEVGGGDGALELTPEITWENVSDEFKGEDTSKNWSKYYNLSYEWSKNGTKIPSAMNDKYKVNTSDPKNAGMYTVKVTATPKDTITLADAKIYKEVSAEAESNVVISNIDKAGSVTTAYNNGSDYVDTEYGKLETDVVYTVNVKGITKDAAATAAVIDAEGKKVSGITVKKNGNFTSDEGVTIGKQKWDIVIPKNTDAGTYKLALKVTDGNETVTIDLGTTCTIKKQTVTVSSDKIVPAGVKHGDPVEKLTFTYGSNDKQNEKAVADKITITLADTAKTPYDAKGYLIQASADDKTVDVELKEAYKKNFKLSGISEAAAPFADMKGTAEVSVVIGEKPLELSVKDVEVALGTEPAFEIAGLENIMKNDTVTAELTSYELIKKNDTTQTVITNDVDKLPAGEYIVRPAITLTGTDAAKYGKTEKNAVLTIRDSAHVISFNSTGGSYVEEMTVRDNETVTAPTPTRAGYKFAGWYSDSKLTKAFDFAAPITKDVTLFAKWEKEISYTVGFDTQGGSKVETAAVVEGSKVTVPADPTKAGYKFAGWYADKEYTKAYDFNTPVTKDVTLFAKWEKEETPSTEKPSTEAPSTEKPSTEQPTTQTPTTQATPAAVGTTTKTSVGTYKVTASSASKKTVAFTKAASKSVKKVTIPSTVTVNGVSYKVTKIADNAFSGCKKMTKVTIPSTVTEIGASSFKNCTKLTSVTIPKNVTKIGKNAFSGDKKLKTVTIKSTKVKTIGKNAFKGIAGKSTIKVPKSKKKAYKKLLKKAGYKKTVK